MKGLILSCLGGLSFAGVLLAEGLPEGDLIAGRALAGQCRTCHGLDGFARIPIAPHIGGEPATYLAAQLQAFRDGRREHEMMNVVARILTDKNIADVSEWYASHATTAVLTADAAQAPLACTGCHGLDGISLVHDAPNLAGETNIYIATQLKAFRTGKREHEIMSPIARELTDDDIREFSDWFAAVKLEIVETEPDDDG